MAKAAATGRNLSLVLRLFVLLSCLGSSLQHRQPTLQTTMLSQYEHGQIVGASWRFNISGKYSFIFNTMNINWTLIDHEAGGIMNTWKDDQHLIKDLKTISIADCRHWLKKLLKHHKEKPNSLLLFISLDLSSSLAPSSQVEDAPGKS
ncbi:retinoic acid early-inducible protein 1-alpha-like [Chionomys nivalis]|uniref:retinoic acid early-inducible protein 1-alpha-like n=1 Tax=Chionomys nivalis TaxID=269649 RepID=UPI00259AC091|nr:retinoic acid early-inducible protein 1-alpha-like [Chionomys nivalis]